MNPNWRDVTAGLSVAGLMLPEAIAYAGIAGLPPQQAIISAIVGCAVYAIFGQSRFAIISPTSSSAAILAAMLLTLQVTPEQKTVLAAVVVALAGLLFVVASLMRLGALYSVISRPVLRGFAFGLAILITVKQMPSIFGVAVPGGALPDIVGRIATSPTQWNPYSLAIGTLAFGALLILRRYPAVPGSLLVIIGGVAASWLLGLDAHGVQLVGKIDVTFGWVGLPAISTQEIAHVSRFALPLVLIIFAESWGTVRNLSLRHGDSIDANRELRALGLANIASATVQGMPVGAGLSAGAASEAAGAQSRITAAVASAGLAAFALLAADAFAFIPEAALAAIIVNALLHALNPAPIHRLFRLDRDAYLALAAAGGVLAFGVLNGMLIAVVLSFALFVRRLTSVHVSVLGRLGATHDFVDIERHPDAVALLGIAILRPAQPLFFGNAEPMLAAISSRVTGDATIRTVIVSLEESFDLDSTALDALIEFDFALEKAGKTVFYARLHDRLRDLLAAAGQTEFIVRSSYSVDDAVAAAQEASP